MGTLIRCRDDLSFTRRDSNGHLVNWSTTGQISYHDCVKEGDEYFGQVADLAGRNELEACHALRWAALCMRASFADFTEMAFINRMAEAAIIGLRAMRNGEQSFDSLAMEKELQKIRDAVGR